ncbi:hypothetical protein [Paracoccus homiensis]|uniref:hypothetical protein n=1 Tax=Paracoccus homiensis TaxID=364199 RepID=UPI00398C8E15
MWIRRCFICLTAMAPAGAPVFAQDSFECHPDRLNLLDAEIRDAAETDSYLALAAKGRASDGRDRIVNLLQNQSSSASAMLWRDRSSDVVIMDAKYQHGGIKSQEYRCSVRTGLATSAEFNDDTSLELSGDSYYPISAVLPVLNDETDATGSSNFIVSLFSTIFGDPGTSQVKSGSLSATSVEDTVEITVAASEEELGVAFSTTLFSGWNDEVMETLQNQGPDVRVGDVLDLGIISSEDERSAREYYAYGDEFVLLSKMSAPITFNVSGLTDSRAPIYLLNESGEVLLGAPIN